MKDDTEFHDEKISEVEDHEDGSFTIKSDEGWCLLVKNPQELPLPEKGSRVRLYGRGLGYPIRGVSLICPNGEMKYHYLTAEEYERKEKREREDQADRDRRAWLDGLADFWKKVNALPEKFRNRICYFMRSPEWGPKFGGYELFSCQEALRIAGVLKNEVFDDPEVKTLEDRFNKFMKADWEVQKKLVPELSHDHSGNTFSTACRLAHLYLTHPELLYKFHGALCPLVGCQDYGCWCTTAEAAAEREAEDKKSKLIDEDGAIGDDPDA